MTENSVKIVIPFESLVEAVRTLSFVEKRTLWEFLDEQLGQYEAVLWENDVRSGREIQEARAAYDAGNFVTLDDYLAQLDNQEQ